MESDRLTVTAISPVFWVACVIAKRHGVSHDRARDMIEPYTEVAPNGLAVIPDTVVLPGWLFEAMREAMD